MLQLFVRSFSVRCGKPCRNILLKNFDTCILLSRYILQTHYSQNVNSTVPLISGIKNVAYIINLLLLYRKSGQNDLPWEHTIEDMYSFPRYTNCQHEVP
jgi:hypothetical protein